MLIVTLCVKNRSNKFVVIWNIYLLFCASQVAACCCAAHALHSDMIMRTRTIGGLPYPDDYGVLHLAERLLLDLGVEVVPPPAHIITRIVKARTHQETRTLAHTQRNGGGALGVCVVLQRTAGGSSSRIAPGSSPPPRTTSAGRALPPATAAADPPTTHTRETHAASTRGAADPSTHPPCARAQHTSRYGRRVDVDLIFTRGRSQRLRCE